MVIMLSSFFSRNLSLSQYRYMVTPITKNMQMKSFITMPSAASLSASVTAPPFDFSCW